MQSHAVKSFGLVEKNECKETPLKMVTFLYSHLPEEMNLRAQTFSVSSRHMEEEWMIRNTQG